jgi:hypothetical protein
VRIKRGGLSPPLVDSTLQPLGCFCFGRFLGGRRRLLGFSRDFRWLYGRFDGRLNRRLYHRFLCGFALVFVAALVLCFLNNRWFCRWFDGSRRRSTCIGLFFALSEALNPDAQRNVRVAVFIDLNNRLPFVQEREVNRPCPKRCCRSGTSRFAAAEAQ